MMSYRKITSDLFKLKRYSKSNFIFVISMVTPVGIDVCYVLYAAHAVLDFNATTSGPIMAVTLYH